MIMDTNKYSFIIEVSVKKNGKIIVLNTDDMQINLYQKSNGEQKLILGIKCYEHPESLHTDVERIKGDGISHYNNSTGDISVLSNK